MTEQGKGGDPTSLPEQKPRKLTRKRQIFVGVYLQTWNASEAARQAGYKKPGQQGHELLKNLEIQEAIRERMEAEAMGATEALKRLADEARANPGDFFKEEEYLDPESNQMLKRNVIDWEVVKARGHLIKKLKIKDGDVEIELYDAQAAKVHIGRHLALFTDNVDLRTGGQPLKGYVGVSPDDWDDQEPPKDAGT